MVFAIQYKVDRNIRIFFLHDLQLFGGNAAMRAGEAHKGNDMLAFAEAFGRLVDLIVPVQAIEFQLKAVLLFGKVGGRIAEIDIV